MNPYEDAYLRKRVGAIIERQQQGAIVIASYADGTTLPTRSDLPPLGRRDSPHAYDARFLRAVLEAIRSPKLRFEANAHNAPMVIRPQNGEEVLYLVMPMYQG